MRNTLKAAREEIVSLRRVNERLSIRVTAIDDMLCLLHGKPGVNSQRGEGLDVLYEIDKALAEPPKNTDSEAKNEG